MLPVSIIAAPLGPNTRGRSRARLLRCAGAAVGHWALVIDWQLGPGHWAFSKDGLPQPHLPPPAPGRADHRAEPRDGSALRADAPAAGDRGDGRGDHAGPEPVRALLARAARLAVPARGRRAAQLAEPVRRRVLPVPH